MRQAACAHPFCDACGPELFVQRSAATLMLSAMVGDIHTVQQSGTRSREKRDRWQAVQTKCMYRRGGDLSGAEKGKAEG